MKIKVEYPAYGRGTVEVPVADYVSDAIVPRHMHDITPETAANTTMAFGRLVEVLAAKGILTLEEVKEVAGGYYSVGPAEQ